MILRWVPLALFAIVFAPGLLRAQPHSSEVKPIFIDIDRPPNNDKMYEDIEIMRRILDRKLTPLYPSKTYPNIGGRTDFVPYGVGTNPFTPAGQPYGSTEYQPYGQPYQLSHVNTQWVMNPYQGYLQGANPYQGYLQGAANLATPVVIPIRSLEGVYLKGQGIVYTATLNSLQSAAKAEKAKKPVSEWESIRRQLRNEKEEPKKPEASKPLSLSDVLLKVLAENGHHFSQLGENESLTIIITVHDARPSSTATKAETGSAKIESKPASGDVVSGLRAEVRDSELLGELHLKQGKHGEAIKAFHYVLTRISDPKREAELHRKLAQCYLMQGQDEKARAELDQAIALLKKEKEAKGKPVPAVKPAPALPVKLIISAPKKLLDQAKEGKITFEEFRRQAHVETLRFEDRRRE